MKKNSSSKSGQKRSLANEQSEQKLFTLGGFWKKNPAAGERLTIGLDLGDRASCWCALDGKGEVLARGEVVSERQPLEHFFKQVPASLVALEVGTHSPWIS